MNKARRVGEDIADKYLGHEANIPMSVQDARYRYYQWLREWYGLGKQEDTNKCPFYQFMFWGSILMLASLVPIIIMKIVELFILKPLAWVVPNTIDEINKHIGKSKMITSWLITICLFVILLAIAGLWSGEVLLWFGWAVHFIFAIPVMILVALFMGIGWFFVEAIPWLFSGILLVLSGLVDFFVTLGLWLYNWPWINLGLGMLFVFGVFLGIGVALYIFYKIGVWLFQSRFAAWVIKKSCTIRESQIEKKKDRRIRIAKTQQEKVEVRLQWEREHRKEVEEKAKIRREKKALKRESKGKWKEFFSMAGQKLWAFLKVFPGWIFVAIWVALKFIALGFWFIGQAFGWIFEKVGDVLVIVWALLTETISNHCPPIDFIMDASDTGRLKIYNSKEYVFECDNSKRTLIIADKLLPSGFKPVNTKKGKRGSIICSILTKELDGQKRYYKYNYDYKDLYYTGYPIEVYRIEKVEYDPPKPRKKKVVKSSEDPA